MGEFQWLFNLIGGAVLTLVGWFVRTTRSDARDTDRALTEFRLEVAKDYVTHTDLADIKNTLFRIETKLDAKQDK